MKKLLTVSLLAMMAVGTARADIASTSYADKVAANAQSAAISTAAEDAATKANTAESNAKKAASDALAAAKTELEGKITAETTRATGAEAALGARIDDISAGELTIKKDAVTATEIKDGEVKTNEIADDAVTAAKLSDDAKALFDAAGAAATAQAAAISAAAKAVIDAEYQTKANIHTTGELTGEALNTKYPSVGYVDTAVSDMQVKSSMVTKTENFTEGEKTSATTYPSMATTSALIADSKADVQGQINAINDASTGILAGAKGYTDGKVSELTNGAVATNTDHIGALGSLTTTANGNLVAAINEVDADATKALADAAAAQGTADEAMNFDDLKTDASWTAAKCGEANAVCSLVSKNGSIAWERVQP